MKHPTHDLDMAPPVPGVLRSEHKEPELLTSQRVLGFGLSLRGSGRPPSGECEGTSHHSVVDESPTELTVPESVRTKRARLAAATRHHPEVDTDDMRRDLRTAVAEQYITRLVAAAPPLTDEQRERLAALLRPAPKMAVPPKVGRAA